MPFLDRLNQKLDKWNARLEQVNAQLEQQRQQQLQQQQQQPQWSTSPQAPPAYPGPPPPLPPRPNSSQTPNGSNASTSATGVEATNAWQTPPPPPPAPVSNYQSPPIAPWQLEQAHPTTNTFQTPPPPPPSAPHLTAPPTQFAAPTSPSAPIAASPNSSITITSDSSGELEPLPILQQTIDTYKAAEAAVPPTVTPGYQSHLKSLLDAISKTQEETSAKAEAARSAQYSQEVFSGGTEAWFRLCYNPASEAMRAGLADIERSYWEIVRSKTDGMGEEDVHEWARAMEIGFTGCGRLRMDWENLEREKREQESSGKSTWLYNNRHDDGVYEAVREVERAKDYQDKVVQAESSSATYARTNQYVNEIVGPFLQAFISACATRRTDIGNVISA
ncbi:hypothetical protein FRC00_008035, partial [Tulasnella sp. 408]